MKNGDPKRIKIQGEAFRIRRDYGILKPGDLCIEDIAMAEDLLITVGSLKGADGRLVRKGKNGLVRISDSITEPTRRRFTMTHELGHWMLHKNDSQFFLCTEGDMYDYQNNHLEVEANNFAAELLMPKRWVDSKFWQLEPSISRIKEIADFFQVSLTAAALRFVELSKQTCLVIFSNGQNVNWWRKKTNLPFWLQSKQPISPLSYAAECYRNNHICSGMEDVEPDAWFPHRDIKISELLEDSIYLSNSNMLISLLWFPRWG